MAIYHCSTKPISRSSGRSSVAAAAYRSGTKLMDDRTGKNHDYTRRDGVVAAVALLPDGNTCNRSELWNAAEFAEKRKDARTAREWVIALPDELNSQQRLDVATSFAESLAKQYNVAIDLAIHTPDKQGDQRNHHAHIMTTTRTAKIEHNKIVLGDKSTLELSNAKRKQLKLGSTNNEIKAIRKQWADLCNDSLKENGINETIDHRTLKEQGIKREPTKHIGVVATNMERRNQATSRADKEKQIKEVDKELDDLQQDYTKNNPDLVIKYYQESVNHKAETITQQADHVIKKLNDQRSKKIKKRNALEEQKPTPPSGLFASLKRTAFEEKNTIWLKSFVAISQRIEQLEKRLGRVMNYRKNASDLAAKQVHQEKPRLLGYYQTAKALKEKARKEKLEQQRQARARKKKQTRPRGRSY